jgi:hypothetical protein
MHKVAGLLTLIFVLLQSGGTVLAPLRLVVVYGRGPKMRRLGSNCRPNGRGRALCWCAAGRPLMDANRPPSAVRIFGDVTRARRPFLLDRRFATLFIKIDDPPRSIAHASPPRYLHPRYLKGRTSSYGLLETQRQSFETPCQSRANFAFATRHKIAVCRLRSAYREVTGWMTTDEVRRFVPKPELGDRIVMGIRSRNF